MSAIARNDLALGSPERLARHEQFVNSEHPPAITSTEVLHAGLEDLEILLAVDVYCNTVAATL